MTRDRYVLLRTTRIFTDVVLMTDALRIAIHLPREVEHPLFIKRARDRRHVSHVALLREPAELESLKPLVREAYEFSTSTARPGQADPG